MMFTAVFLALVALTTGLEEPARGSSERTSMTYAEAYAEFIPEVQADNFPSTSSSSSSSEARQRVQFFKSSRKNINKINDNGANTFVAEFNKLSMLSDAEKSSMTGLMNVSDIEGHREGKRLRTMKRSRVGLEKRSSLNWYPDYVTDVKDQGSCGSCWAFAGITVLESRAYIQGAVSSLTQFSEQEILDCNDSGSGCSGGWYSTVWSYVESYGRLASSAAYPYTISQGSCSSSSKANSLPVSLDYDDYGGWDEDDLVSDLAGGPVAIAVNANDDFMAYGSGVFNECVDTNLNHAVVAVGYTNSYFLVRNSWGDDWGVAGYIKLARDLCTDYTYSYYSAHIESFSSSKKREVEEKRAELF